MSKGNHLHVKGQTLPPTNVKSGFTQISNAILLDERLSFKARGILALILSRPTNWRIYVMELIARSAKDGKKAVQSGIKELFEIGYLTLSSNYNQKTGQFEGRSYQLVCLLYTSPSPRDATLSRMPSSA